MGEQDQNARIPRGILGIYFLFRSSAGGYQESKPSQNARDVVPDGKPKGSASQNIPEHGRASQNIPDGAKKQTLPPDAWQMIVQSGWHWQDATMDGAEHPPKIPEGQKMVLTVSNTIIFLNRSPLFKNT